MTKIAKFTGLSEHRVERLKEMLDSYLRGIPAETVIAEAQQAFKISEWQARNDMAELKRDLAYFRNRNLDQLIKSHVQKYEFLYEKLTLLGNDSLALDALRQKEELAGIIEQHYTVDVNNIDMTRDEPKEKLKMKSSVKDKMKSLISKAKKSS